MKKHNLTFLIVFLISLPGCCGWRKKSSTSKKVVERTSVFSRVDIPLAADDSFMDTDDTSVRSFFDDDMQDFMSFTQDQDFALEKAGTQGRGSDEYSWLDENKETNSLEVAYFDFDRHTIKPEEQAKAKKNAQKIKKSLEADKNLIVAVEGHACKEGSASYDLALSEKRAKSYANFLEANGVPADRMKRVGRGKEMLVLKEGTREEQWVNRRVELHEIHDNALAPAA